MKQKCPIDRRHSVRLNCYLCWRGFDFSLYESVLTCQCCNVQPWLLWRKICCLKILHSDSLWHGYWYDILWNYSRSESDLDINGGRILDVLFCLTTLTFHLFLAPSRRGDLQILGFCLLHWLCGSLPWDNVLKNPTQVQEAKARLVSTRHRVVGYVLCIFLLILLICASIQYTQ